VLQKRPQNRDCAIPRSLREGQRCSRNCIGRAEPFGVPSIVVARITGRRFGFVKVTRLSNLNDGSSRASRRAERGNAPDNLRAV